MKNKKIKSTIKFDHEQQQQKLDPQIISSTKQDKKLIKTSHKQQKQSNQQSSHSYIAIAFPDSIVSNAQSSELRSYFMSQLARIFTIFKVDEVIIMRDYSYIPKSSQFDASSYIARNLQYLETPQYLRKHLFPIHSDLKNVGLMNPIESKHHLKTEEICPYREGVVVDRPTKGNTAWVEIGLQRQVLIDYALSAGTRVTLKLDDPYATKLTGKPISTQQVKEDGYYWGYTVQIQSKFHKLLQRDDFDQKVLIQSDNNTESIAKSIDANNYIANGNKVLLVFSGYESITNFSENDEKAKLSSEQIYEHFDTILRFNNDDFGVKQLRLEEQIFMLLQKYRNQ